MLESRRARGCDWFSVERKGSCGADEVIVDLKRLTVPVGVIPILETPKRGSYHSVKVPQNRSMRFVSYPRGFRNPWEWFCDLVGDRLLQTQILQSCPERCV